MRMLPTSLILPKHPSVQLDLPKTLQTAVTFINHSHFFPSLNCHNECKMSLHLSEGWGERCSKIKASELRADKARTPCCRCGSVKSLSQNNCVQSSTYVANHARVVKHFHRTAVLAVPL